MSTAASNKSQSSYWIKTAVFFMIMFGFGFLPAPEPLTSYGMHWLYFLPCFSAGAPSV